MKKLGLVAELVLDRIERRHSRSCASSNNKACDCGLQEELDALREIIRNAEYSPSGDNHHNALACPYCSPEKR